MYANAGCIDDLPLRRHDLEEIESAQTVSGFPSTGAGLRELARALERTAIVVESRWAEIPEPIRRLLELSVYTTTSNRFSVRFSLKRFGLFAKCAFILAQIVAQGNLSAVGAFAAARTRYQRAILDAIERDNQSYERRVADALTNLPTSGKDAVSASEYMRRIRAISKYSRLTDLAKLW